MKKDKSVSISFFPPTEFACARRTDFNFSSHYPPKANANFSLNAEGVSECDVLMSFARTFFETNES